MRSERSTARLGPVTGAAAVILVVEDDRGVRAVTRRILIERGFEVLTADHPAEALRICSAHTGRIDLLLTDVVMPSMSGIEVSRRVTEMLGDIPVLFMSGYPDEDIARHGPMDENSYLPKPFNSFQLVDKVEAALTLARV